MPQLLLPWDVPDWRYGCAAKYLAVLAFPGASETRRRDAFEKACSSLMAYSWNAKNPGAKIHLPSWSRDSRFRPPRLFKESPLTAGWRRICKRRLPAAKLVRRLLAEDIDVTQAIEELPHRLRVEGGLEIKAVWTRHVDYSEQGAPFLFKHVWAESGPVLHLAAAFELALSANPRRGRSDDGAVDLYSVLEDPGWVPVAVREAGQILEQLHRRARLPRRVAARALWRMKCRF